MTHTEEHPRVQYLRQRAATDAARCEVIMRDALWRYITDGRDTYVLPDNETELERVAEILSALVQSGLGAHVEHLVNGIVKAARFEAARA